MATIDMNMLWHRVYELERGLEHATATLDARVGASASFDAAYEELALEANRLRDELDKCERDLDRVCDDYQDLGRVWTEASDLCEQAMREGLAECDRLRDELASERERSRFWDSAAYQADEACRAEHALTKRLERRVIELTAERDTLTGELEDARFDSSWHAAGSRLYREAARSASVGAERLSLAVQEVTRERDVARGWARRWKAAATDVWQNRSIFGRPSVLRVDRDRMVRVAEAWAARAIEAWRWVEYGASECARLRTACAEYHADQVAMRDESGGLRAELGDEEAGHAATAFERDVYRRGVLRLDRVVERMREESGEAARWLAYGQRECESLSGRIEYWFNLAESRGEHARWAQSEVDRLRDENNELRRALDEEQGYSAITRANAEGFAAALEHYADRESWSQRFETDYRNGGGEYTGAHEVYVGFTGEPSGDGWAVARRALGIDEVTQDEAQRILRESCGVLEGACS